LKARERQSIWFDLIWFGLDSLLMFVCWSHKYHSHITKVLIIDEVSMLSGDLFDKLDYIAQKIKTNTKPFGGIQVCYVFSYFYLYREWSYYPNIVNYIYIWTGHSLWRLFSITTCFWRRQRRAYQILVCSSCRGVLKREPHT
jgi:hypothetical protein